MVDATLVVDIGGTSVRIGHVAGSSLGNAMATFSSDRLRVSDPVGALESELRRYAEERGLTVADAVIGVPFSPDPSYDTALSSPNIPQFEGVPVRTGLAERLGVPVYLERDITLLLLGEWRAGAAMGARSVVGMFVGTGVGGAVLHDGVPYRGATGSAVELGHIPIRAEGRRCVCGNVDCLEAYACGHVLREIADRAGIPIDDVFACEALDDHTRVALHEFVRDLAYALATAVNLFHPDLALVGGGIPAMRGFPRERFERIFRAHLRRPAPASSVMLAWATLGSRAALHGATAVVANRHGVDHTTGHAPEGGASPRVTAGLGKEPT